MSDNVTIEGIDELVKKLTSLGVDIKQEAGPVAMKAMLRVESAAKQKCNVDNGLTRASIATKQIEQGDEVLIQCGTNVKSAAYLEFGTGIYAENGQGRKTPWLWQVESRKWASILGVEVGDSVLWHGSHPHPFMRPAWDENKDGVYADVQKGLQSLIKRYTA